jgi:hypothetical protein
MKGRLLALERQRDGHHKGVDCKILGVSRFQYDSDDGL